MKKQDNRSDHRVQVRRIGSTAKRLAEKSYENRVCRSEYYPSCLADVPGASLNINADQSIREYITIMDEVGMEVQIVSGEIDRGTPRFPSKMIPPHPNVDNELLPRYLEAAHGKGIIILAYYPIIYCKPLKPLHPEWMMKFLDDGRPPIINQGWFCLNSPFRDWLPEYLIEYLDNLDLDGFYFDDTNWGSHGDHITTTGIPLAEHEPNYASCHCVYCEDLFRTETGLKIPRKVDFDSLDFRHFVNWRYEKFKDFVHHLFHRIKEKHPHAILELNCYSYPNGDWSYGHPINPLHLEDVGGYYFVETFRSLRDPGFVGKLLRATGTPFAIFRNITQTLQGFGGAPYPEHFSAAVFAFSAIANGGQPCGDPFGHPIAVQKDNMKWVFTELKKRAEYIEGDTVKYVALHYSQQNRDFRPNELAKNLRKTSSRREPGQKDAHGAHEMLNRSHLLLDFILDETLTYETLSKYPVLFLSNSACLSDRQCEVIRKFVKNGGTLIATHQTSLLDELGQERGEFALADVLGVDYTGISGSDRNHGVVYVPQDKSLSEEFGYVICFYGQDSSVAIRQDAKLEVLCTRSSLKGENPLGNFDPRKDYDSSEPTVTVNTFGEGKAFYIAGDVGTAYMNNPYPPLKRFVANLVKRTKPPVEIEAPEAIEATAAIRPSGELMVHLVNNPTPLLPWRIRDHADAAEQREHMTSFFALQEVNPIHDIKISFNAFKVNSARLPLQEHSLAITGIPSTVTLPQVKIHEVLLVEIMNGRR